MSSFNADQWAAGLAWAKIREPDIKSPTVLRSVAQKLLADLGGPRVVRMVEAFREGEISKWQGHEWRARPKMSQREARLAGMERAAKEAPWLFAAGTLDITPDVPPGPGTFAPNHSIDNTTSTTYQPGGSRSAAKALSDDELLREATSIVRDVNPHLEGTAFHAAVHKIFSKMRAGQRAKAGAR